jgi:anti-sigma factor RsiW
VDNHIVEHISLYLDDELQEADRLALETHVKGCAECRAALEAERDLIVSVRKARPVYAAPDALRSKITSAIRESGARREFARVGMFKAACALLVIAAAGIWFFGMEPLRGERGSSFVNMAVSSHLRYLRGELPLEVFSESPETISAWFNGKLGFNLKLPEYPQRPFEPKPYHVEGARLVGFNNDYVAYVVYRLNGHPISLLVTPESIAKPAGGEEIPWEGLRFHFQSVSGWKVLTWSDDGLTYALVSNLAERGQASCIVCHQDERVFRGLNSPSRPM